MEKITESYSEYRDFENRKFNEQRAYLQGVEDGYQKGHLQAVALILETMTNKFYQLGSGEAFHWMKDHMEVYIRSKKKI